MRATGTHSLSSFDAGHGARRVRTTSMARNFGRESTCPPNPRSTWTRSTASPSRSSATSPPPNGHAERHRRPARPLRRPRRAAARPPAPSSPTRPASTSATPASGCRRWPATATSPTTTRPSASPCRPSTPSAWSTPTARSTSAASSRCRPDQWRNIDLLTEAFQHGGGVPQERYGDEFWCGFERFTRHRLPQQPRARTGSRPCPRRTPRLRGGRRGRRRRLRQRAGAALPGPGLPERHAGRLRQLRPGDRGGQRQRPGRRAGRPGALRGLRRDQGHPRPVRPDHHLRRRPRHAPPAPGAGARSSGRSSRTGPTSCWSSTSSATSSATSTTRWASAPSATRPAATTA